MKRFCIDLGNSSTRVEENFEEVKITPNNFVSLGMDEKVSAVMESKEIEDNLDFKIWKTAGGACEYFPCHIVEGSLVDKTFSYSEKPNINMHKYMQPISYINIVLNLALKAIEEDDNDREYTVYLAVPPIEFSAASATFNDKLNGEYKVTFDRLGKTVEFKIIEVKCVEEAKAAMMAYFFKVNDNKVAIREERNEMRSKKVMIIDVGAGTTDICIIDGGVYLDRTAKSIKVGGNLVTDYVMNKISETECIDLSFEEAEKVVCTGMIQMGNSYKDVSGIVDDGKRELAHRIMQYIPEYLKSIATPASLISVVLVSGGGSLESKFVDSDGIETVTSKPISVGITEEFSKWSPGTMVMYYGDRARLANVDGIRILAAIDDQLASRA